MVSCELMGDRQLPTSVFDIVAMPQAPDHPNTLGSFGPVHTRGERTHTSATVLGSSNCRGITPTTIHARPSNVSVRPSAPFWPSNRRCQRL